MRRESRDARLDPRGLAQTVRLREFGLDLKPRSRWSRFAASVHDLGMAVVGRSRARRGAAHRRTARAMVQQHVVLGGRVLARLATMGADCTGGRLAI